MKKNLSEKSLYIITTLLIVVTLFLLLVFSSQRSSLIFPIVFVIFYWQRKQLQGFFQKIKNSKIRYAIYILIGWFGGLFLEYGLGRLVFNPKPIANFIIGLGFYLPYFAFWHEFYKRYQFNFLEVFYLSGFGRLVFDLLITRKLFMPAVLIFNPKFALITIIGRAIAMLTLFGTFTALPFLFLPEQKSNYHKPLKQYLIGLTPNFLAAGVFIVWAVILKIIFT